MLQPHQISHERTMSIARNKHKVTIDSSGTGTGKTYTTLYGCKNEGRKPFVICPKAVMVNWINVARVIGIELFGITSYESLVRGKWYVNKKPQKCKYLINEKPYYVNLPLDVILIFDEVHKCKNDSTYNKLYLEQTLQIPNKIMLISATLADKLHSLKFFGYILGLYPAGGFYLWFKERGGDCELTTLRKAIFNEYGSRMNISDLNLPNNNLTLVKIVQKTKNKDIQLAIEDMCDRRDASIGLGTIILDKIQCELRKLETIINGTKLSLSKGHSVAIFINYSLCIDLLVAKLNHLADISIVKGGQSIIERETNIQLFQSNKNRIIICNIQAGGVGLSMHDIDGRYPRDSYICATWSGTEVVQCIGRIWRSGLQSKTNQFILYVPRSYDEHIYNIMTNKIKVISSINGDVEGFEFD